MSKGLRNYGCLSTSRIIRQFFNFRHEIGVFSQLQPSTLMTLHVLVSLYHEWLWHLPVIGFPANINWNKFTNGITARPWDMRSLGVQILPDTHFWIEFWVTKICMVFANDFGFLSRFIMNGRCHLIKYNVFSSERQH